MTKIIKIDPAAPDPLKLKEARELLMGGEPLVFPTETVYGLGGDASSREVVEGIFRIKGRLSDKPLAIMIGKLEMLNHLVKEIPPSARRLMEAYWPGPLTLIFHAKDLLVPAITAGTGRIGVRFPDHPVPQALISMLGKPIVATSANLSGKASPVTAEEALKQLDGMVPLVLDGGACESGKASTVVDCTVTPVKILREGTLSPEAIQGILGME